MAHQHVKTPRSVVNLQIHAQISHHGVAEPEELMQALIRPDTPVRRGVAAQALQEAEIPELADLLADQVIPGNMLHALIAGLARDGAIRRPDLLEWSERFS